MLTSVLWYGVKRRSGVTSHITIGRLASATGVGVETIRYYQRLGLLDTPKRPFGGQRSYSDDHAKCLRFIKRAQRLGFTLDEIRGLLTMGRSGDCRETREMALDKQRIIEHKLADLQAMYAALGTLVQQCGQQPDGGICPVLDALSRSSDA